MNLENSPNEESFLQKKEQLDVLNEVTAQKKEAFQQLTTDIENLNIEIEKLKEERKALIAASAEQSVLDCLYG